MAAAVVLFVGAVLMTAPLEQNEIAQALDGGEEFTTDLLAVDDIPVASTTTTSTTTTTTAPSVTTVPGVLDPTLDPSASIVPDASIPATTAPPTTLAPTTLPPTTLPPAAGLLLDAGGDLVAGGQPPAGGWLVGVEDPGAADPAAPDPLVVVVVETGAVATSSVRVRN